MCRWYFGVRFQTSEKVFYALEEVDDCVSTRTNISGRLTGCHHEQFACIEVNAHDKKDPNAGEDHVRGREHLQDWVSGCS